MTMVSGSARFASRLRRSKRSSSSLSLSLSNVYGALAALVVVVVRMVTLGAGFDKSLPVVLEEDVLELEDPSETRRTVGDVDGR